MIKHLLRQIWAQRTVNVWLWAELIIVSICLSYVVDYLYTTARTYCAPLGFNTEHVYRVYLNEVPNDSKAYLPQVSDSLHTEQLFQVLDRLRSYTGVEQVAVSNQSHPYNQAYSNGSKGIDTTWVHGNMYYVSPSFFSLFQLTDKQGQTDPLVSAAMQPGALIISADGERKFAEAGIQALGSSVKDWDSEKKGLKVTAICSDVRFDDFQNVYPAYYECISEDQLLRQHAAHVEFCVRVLPQADGPDFFSDFRQAMKIQLRLGNLYLLDVISFDDIRTNYFRANGAINDVKSRLAGLAFLLVNILLGVIGTFWIRTQQRRGEIGLRIALGSSRSGIRHLLVAEGLLLLLFATLPTILIDANIVYAGFLDGNEENSFTLSRFLIGQGITFILMGTMIVGGILLPARQAMRIRPAEALHEE